MPRPLTRTEIQSFREHLCSVAARLFAERGYAGVTMRGIAGELGVSPMTTYRYFPNKAAIYAEIRTAAFQRFGARVSAAADTEPEPLDRLRALFEAYVHFGLDEPGAYRIMFGTDPPPEAEPDEAQLAIARETWNPLLDTLTEAVERGLLEGDPLTLAHLCWVQVHGLVSLHIAGRLVFERSLDDLLAHLFHVLLHGILARPAGEPT